MIFGIHFVKRFTVPFFFLFVYLSLVEEDGTVRVELMRNWFDNPHLLRQPGVLDAVLRGLIDQWPQDMDEWVSEDVTNHLFQRLAVHT